MKVQEVNRKKYLVKALSLVLVASFMFFGLIGCDSKEEKEDAKKEEKEEVKEEAKEEDTKKEEKKENSSLENIGNFKTEDLEGNKVTQDIFKENDLTMLNVFSTSCGPCMAELPDLAKLSGEFKDKNFAIVGLNIDLDGSGAPDEDSREAVSSILSKAGSDMKVIFADMGLMESIFSKTDAIPYTIFIDKDGNIVGESYVGSRSKDEWVEIINKELK